MFFVYLRHIVMATLIGHLPLSAGAVGLLRDADIEYALEQLAKPVLTAAGLSASQVKF